MDGSAGATAETPSGRIISEDDIAILCIYAEARGEPYDGQVAVGNVIRNRVARGYFANGTVLSAVVWPHQFSWMNTGDAQRIRVLGAKWEDPSIEVAQRAWRQSALMRPAADAVLYHADYVHPYWAKVQGIELVQRIGRHLFYRDVTR